MRLEVAMDDVEGVEVLNTLRCLAKDGHRVQGRVHVPGNDTTKLVRDLSFHQNLTLPGQMIASKMSYKEELALSRY